MLVFRDQWKMISDLNMSHGNMSGFVSYLLFGFTLEIKLTNFDFENRWNTLILFDKKGVSLNMFHGKMSDLVWFPLCVFTLVIRMKNFDFESHWNIWIFFDKKKYSVRFEYVPWKNVWFCFISIVWVHFSHKTETFRFWRSLNTQILLCPVKQCLIRFKLCYLRRVLAISWEIRILNFIKMVQCFSIQEPAVRSKFLPVFFCLKCIFWHYYRNSFELKMFRLILRYIEML